MANFKKPKDKNRSATPVDPDDQWNAEERAADNFQPALDQCAAILRAVADADTDDLPDSAGRFLEDVEEKVNSVKATIGNTGRCSDKQQTALNNWQAAVGRCIERGGDRE